MTDSSLNILVVDDFATMRQIVRKALKQLGYNHIFEADDGTSALEVLKKEKIQFIIADWNMPQMPGIELLKSLPFLMITAEGQRGYVLEAVKHKVSNYIVKPFTPEVLREKINRILETK
jgi:two-component system chemotaxis response regulator CheY